MTALTVLAGAFFVAVGVGVWTEISEQRRLGRMARDFKARNGL